jgi:hypothetical protein
MLMGFSECDAQFCGKTERDMARACPNGKLRESLLPLSPPRAVGVIRW